jgi:hypothetical protein
LCSQFPPEGSRVDVVDEGPHSVDLYDRKPLSVAGLEVCVPAYIHLFEFEGHDLVNLPNDLAGTLAEVAAGCVVEGDHRGRHTRLYRKPGT